jgi:hypothetical protein
MNGHIENNFRSSNNSHWKETRSKKTLLQRLTNRVQQRPHLYQGKNYLVYCIIWQTMLAPTEQFFVKTTVLNEGKFFAKSEYFVIRHSRDIVEINLDNLYTQPEARGLGMASLAMLVGFIVCTQKILPDLFFNSTDTVIFTLTDMSRATGKETSFYQDLYLNPGKQIFNKTKEKMELLPNVSSLWHHHHVNNQAPPETFSAGYLENFLRSLLPRSTFKVFVKE